MLDVDHISLLVIWEVTQACDLACAPCRPAAVPERHPAELTTDEGRRLLAEIGTLGNPLLAITGGDPLKRPDLIPLIEYSVALGIRTRVNPSATPLLTRRVIQKLKMAGTERMEIGIDGPDETTHDGFRGEPGMFQRACVALQEARDIGLDTEVRTAITRMNFGHLRGIASLCEFWNTRRWSLHFLAGELMYYESEQVFADLRGIERNSSFPIQTTDADLYPCYCNARTRQTTAFGDCPSLFISHTGDVYLSGARTVCAGNIHVDSLTELYHNSPLFQQRAVASAGAP